MDINATAETAAFITIYNNPAAPADQVRAAYAEAAMIVAAADTSAMTDAEIAHMIEYTAAGVFSRATR